MFHSNGFSAFVLFHSNRTARVPSPPCRRPALWTAAAVTHTVPAGANGGTEGRGKRRHGGRGAAAAATLAALPGGSSCRCANLRHTEDPRGRAESARHQRLNRSFTRVTALGIKDCCRTRLSRPRAGVRAPAQPRGIRAVSQVSTAGGAVELSSGGAGGVCNTPRLHPALVSPRAWPPGQPWARGGI